jgi:hypothetical protein
VIAGHFCIRFDLETRLTNIFLIGDVSRWYEKW